MSGVNWTIILAVFGVAGLFAKTATSIWGNKGKRKECAECFAHINTRLDNQEKAIEDQRDKITEHGVEIRGIYKRIDEIKTNIEGLQRDIKEFLITAYKLLGSEKK